MLPASDEALLDVDCLDKYLTDLAGMIGVILSAGRSAVFLATANVSKLLKTMRTENNINIF